MVGGQISFLLLFINICYSEKLTDEKIREERTSFLENNGRLFDYLFQDYVPQLPPVYTKRNLINESLNDYIDNPKDYFEILLLNVKLVEVNPMKQLMTIIFHYTMVWTDVRLRWSIQDFGNITQIYVPRKRLWIPDVSPFDNAALIDTRAKINQWGKIFYDGSIMFPQSTVTSVNCPMTDVINFPFDIHTCSIKLLSYTFPFQEVRIDCGIAEWNTADRTGNNEWDVMNMTYESGTIFPDDAPTQQNEFTFTVKRNPSFYVVLVIFPSFILTFISVAGFFTSNLIIDDSVKYEMGMTTIMSKTALIGIVSEIVPKTEQTPKLTKYVLWNLLIVLFATGVIMVIPKMFQFISLCFTSCKHQKKGRFRSKFWIFRGVFTFLCLLFFETLTLFNLEFIIDEHILNMFFNGLNFENLVFVGVFLPPPEILKRAGLCFSLTNIPHVLMFIFVLALLCKIFVVVGQVSSQDKNFNLTNSLRMEFLDDNQRLYHHLFDFYNRYLPPIYTKRAFDNASDILQFNNYSVPKDFISITLVYAKLLEVAWIDQRLIWDPKAFGDIDHLYINRKQVWAPEVTPFDSMEVTDTRPEFKQYATLFPGGEVGFYVSSVVTTNCEMDVTNFPFDTQNCSIRLLSYSFNVWEIELNSSVFKTVDPNLVGNDEWEVLSVDAVSAILDKDTNPTQINQFTFHMKRNPSYYAVLIIAPSFILSFLCIAGMFTSPLEADDIEKIAMGLTTIMSSVVMISILSQSIPKTKYIPKLSNYITMNLLTVSFAIIVAIVVPKVGQLCWLVFRLIRCCCRKIQKQEKTGDQEKKTTTGDSCCKRFTWLFKGLLTGAILFVFEFIVIGNLVTLLLNENTRDAFGLKK